MIDRTTKLRWRRNFRRKQRQIEDISSGAEEQLDRHFFRRLGRLYEVRRFVISWILLVVLLLGLTVVQTRALGSYYQTVSPLAGGIYTEGIVGSFTNANPIFANGEVDNAVSRLVFSSLMTYDANNQFVGSLAKSLTVDPTGKIYTAVLNSNLKWDDGKPLTASDVAFTFQTIQNPDVKSPLFSAWSGIKVAVLNPTTVTFTLPNVLASFPYSLTTGILPKHILETVDPSSLRSAPFNTTEPVGSGPFKWHGVEVVGDSNETREQHISLSANNKYFAGRPKLNEFIIRSYRDEGKMIKSFKADDLTAMAGVQDVPDDLQKTLDLGQYNVPVTGAVMAFFNTTKDPMNDSHLRNGLTWATDEKTILASLTYPGVGVNSPFLHSMLGYDSSIVQRPFDLSQANNALDASGWAMGADGIRLKDGKKLTIGLYTLDNIDYANTAHFLRDQWRKVGVLVNVTSLNQSDLQSVVSDRSYDVLLYGVSLGLDPDQFAYWYSTQAEVTAQRRLNFSDYSSKTADAALEAGRTRLDPALRVAKYRPFLEAWRDDAPAVALYQPHYLYVTHGTVFNFNERALNTPSDRFANVENWMIRSERTTKK